MLAEPTKPPFFAVQFAMQSIALCGDVLAVNENDYCTARVMLLTEGEKKIMHSAVYDLHDATTKNGSLLWT